MLTAQTMINASPNEIFQYWEDTDCWYLWNEELLNFALPHGFSYGSDGWIVGSSGKRWQFRIVHIDYGRSFTAEFSLPLCRLLVINTFRIWQGQTEVSIDARFSGILATLYRKLYRENVLRFMRTTLDGLKLAAEQGLRPNHSQPVDRRLASRSVGFKAENTRVTGLQ